jgi:hypothetical protein
MSVFTQANTLPAFIAVHTLGEVHKPLLRNAPMNDVAGLNNHWVMS